ncbi:MAG TPA: hypothetical protein VEF89_19455 [Solirubrobacteraceae bacterium]|nr:hypothetical protein [Solirubrobacteraceae bacterium]
MTRMGYWAMTLTAATAGGFLAVDRYAFATNHAIRIAFGVAIAVTISAAGVAGALTWPRRRGGASGNRAPTPTTLRGHVVVPTASPTGGG